VQEHLVNQQSLVFGLLGLIGVALAPDGTMGNINKVLGNVRHRHQKNAPRAVAPHAAAFTLPVRVVPTASGPPALELSAVTKRFGGVVAVNGVDLIVEPGEVHGLIGPNGSGKTTLLNMISGIAPVTSGRVLVFGRDDTKSSAPKRSGQGVSRTFQNLQLWKKMSVRDNVLVGCHRNLRVNTLQAALGTPGGRRAERAAAQRCDELLSLVGLSDRSADLAGALPFAEQRRLEIARALAASPTLLLLDEPAAGLHPADVHHLLDLIGAIKASGVSVILVEHHMELVMAVSDVITVLEFGSIIAEGSPAEVQNNPVVIAAYLGVQEAVA
jgi:branched-chain amino acid transport system permease protein